MENANGGSKLRTSLLVIVMNRGPDDDGGVLTEGRNVEIVNDLYSG